MLRSYSPPTGATMGECDVKRKVASWREYQPPRQWFAKLECGHDARPDWDDCPMEDADKERIERGGGLVLCVPCSRQAEKIRKLEEELAAAKAGQRQSDHEVK